MRTRTSLALTCCLLAATGIGHTAEIAPITVDAAIALAMENSPGLKASEHRVRAREAESQQARLFSNPEIEAEVENVAGTGPLSGTDAAEYTVMISQPILLGGQRSKQGDVAEADRRLAEWTSESERRDLVRDVKVAFTELLADQEYVELSKELAKLSEELVETAERRVTSGGASVLEQTKAEIERAVSLADKDQSMQRLTATRVRLATLLGLSVDELPPAKGDLYDLGDLPVFEDLKEQLAANPDWARWSSEMKQREAEVALADAQGSPELNLGVGWRRDEGAGADAFVFAAGLPLPLFERNQGARKAARHELAAAEEERKASELKLERELAAAYSELSQAHARAVSIRDRILPAAQKAFEVSCEGYLQGRFGYLDLLDAQRTLFETKGKYIASLGLAHRAATTIERLTATED